MIYSKFLNEYVDFSGQYVQEEIYYQGDLSNVDLVNDWRFRDVKKRRKQAIFLGLVDRDFPEIKITNWEES